MIRCRKYILFLTLFFTAFLSYSQGRVVINDDAYISMNGGTAANPIYLVMDNPNANAMTTSGTGGNLISENEYNKVRWNIVGTTGNYEIPFTTGTGTDVKIPLVYGITGAGAGGTHIDFSTYPTTVANTPYPSMVSHVLDQNTETADNSNYLIDRFWLIDAMNYTTRPSSNIDFGYDGSETAGNLIAPGSLLAQRFNTVTNSWTGGGPGVYLFYGADNGTNAVQNASVPSSEMYQAWTLVEHSNPLPVELKDFSAECAEDFVALDWTTASESNSSHFDIEKSTDGFLWEVIKTVQAAGNSTSENYYHVRDYNPSGQLAYYRLVQYDIDGKYEVFDVQSLAPCSENTFNIEVFSMNNGQYQVKITTPENQSFEIDLISLDGRKVRKTRKVNTVKGENIFLFNDEGLSTGIYMLTVQNSIEQSAHKILIH